MDARFTDRVDRCLQGLEVHEFRQQFKGRGLVFQLRQPQPCRRVDADQPVRDEPASAILDRPSGLRTDQPGQKGLESLAAGIVKVIVPLAQKRRDDRTRASRMIGMRLAGQPRDGLKGTQPVVGWMVALVEDQRV
jgi:hypothetical protein